MEPPVITPGDGPSLECPVLENSGPLCYPGEKRNMEDDR